MANIFLSIPEAGVFSFMRGVAIIGESLQKNHNKVYIPDCNGHYFRCPYLSMNRLEIESSESRKKSLCDSCRKVREEVRCEYGFEFIDLNSIVTEDDYYEIGKIIGDFESDVTSLTFEGFEVGKIVQYDFILETKFPYGKNKSTYFDELYKVYIKNTILSIIINKRIISKYNINLLLTFNEYAQCQAARLAAEKAQIRRMALAYPVNFNVDTRRFMLWDKTCEYWRYNHIKNWDEFKNYPIGSKEVIECWKDTLFRMTQNGSHIFSHSKKDDPEVLIGMLELDRSKKTVIAYTSSEDERTSVETAMQIWNEDPEIYDAFPDQLAWLSFLKQMVDTRDDIQIIIRIHPREGRKQFGIESENYIKLKKNLICSENFIIVWPEDPISSYDLMELADLCLIQWSFMGVEATRLGIPTLSYTSNMLYPDDDFIKVGTSESDYQEKFDSLLGHYDFKSHLIKAFRYYNWRIFIPSFDCSNEIELKNNDAHYWPKLSTELSDELNSILIGKKDLINYNIERWKKSNHNSDIEKTAMELGIRIFINDLFQKKPKEWLILFKIWRKIVYILTYKRTVISKKVRAKKYFGNYKLVYLEDNSNLNRYRVCSFFSIRKRYLINCKPYVYYINNGKVIKRYSIMLSKLLEFYRA